MNRAAIRTLVMAAWLGFSSPGVVFALDLEVHPGESIQAAINQAIAGDRLIIYGQSGYEYDESLTLKENLVLEGRDNPVILSYSDGVSRQAVALKSGTILRGLTIKNPYYPQPSGGTGAVVFDYAVQHAAIDGCLILGQLQLYGSGNIVQNSIIRDTGYVMQIFGANNYLSGTVLHSVGPTYDQFGAPQAAAVLALTGPGINGVSGGTRIWDTTIYGWGSRTSAGGKVTAHATGIKVTGTAGSDNYVWDIIIANSGLRDIDSDSSVVVTYSLLAKGTDDQQVSLREGVLVGMDPRFVSPEAGDFHLKPSSPAVDAGDPQQPLDPDGTRGDMGALPLDQRLTPANPDDPPRLQILQPDLNGDGLGTVADINLAVANYGHGWPPTIRVGTMLNFFVKGMDPEGQSLTYTATNLPSGSCFDKLRTTTTAPVCGARQFAWTPTAAQVGSYAVTFTVSDGTFTDSQTLPITVTP